MINCHYLFAYSRCVKYLYQCLSVCLSVCRPVCKHISPKPHIKTLPNFLYMLLDVDTCRTDSNLICNS